MKDSNLSVFYVLDFDRTLFDTMKSVELMKDAVALHSNELVLALEQRFEEYSSQGESFAVRDFIVEDVGEEEAQKIQARYHDAAVQRDLLYVGARELIAYIRTNESAQMGILTYGSPLGQAMKIEAAVGLENIPYLVTSETFKGALIASWRQADGLYHIPEELGGYKAASIVFVDDKPFSFKGLPMDSRGYLVKSVFDAGMSKLPSQVTVVDSLLEVVVAEKKHAS